MIKRPGSHRDNSLETNSGSKFLYLYKARFITNHISNFRLERFTLFNLGKMKLNYFTTILICSLVCSCTGLTKSQIQTTKSFAIATKDISRVPSDIYFRIYQLKAQSQTLQLNTILATNDSAKESIQFLKHDFDEKVKFIEIAEAFSTSYQIVERYASLVMCLLDESYLREFNKNKDAWQVNFTGLVHRYNQMSVTKIPPSVGSLTSSIISEMGQLRIAQLQKKYLRNAIQTARVPFENICEDFILLDSLKLRNELANLPNYLDNNYANFLENIRAYEKDGNNPYSYYKEYTPIYSSWLSQINELNELATGTIEAFRSLKTAFGELEAYVNASNPGPPPRAFKELMKVYGDLKGIYSKFQFQREKLIEASLIK